MTPEERQANEERKEAQRRFLEQRPYAKGWGRCERCRSERQSFALVRDGETGLICCSSRALCDAYRAIRDARDDARDAADAADPTGSNSGELVSRLVPLEEETADDRRRRGNRERIRKHRAELKAKKAGGQ